MAVHRRSGDTSVSTRDTWTHLACTVWTPLPLHQEHGRTHRRICLLLIIHTRAPRIRRGKWCPLGHVDVHDDGEVAILCRDTGRMMQRLSHPGTGGANTLVKVCQKIVDVVIDNSDNYGEGFVRSGHQAVVAELCRADARVLCLRIRTCRVVERRCSECACDEAWSATRADTSLDVRITKAWPFRYRVWLFDNGGSSPMLRLSRRRWEGAVCLASAWLLPSSAVVTATVGACSLVCCADKLLKQSRALRQVAMRSFAQNCLRSWHALSRTFSNAQ